MEQDTITLNIEVSVTSMGDEATVIVPPEVRLTERLVGHLSEALKARDLVLKHWTLTTPEQEKELESLPNVVMETEE